ncbi:MAG TPA: hypothetical protein VGH20_14435 [Myxococcales bacterium]|jgi:hypothetical protein
MKLLLGFVLLTALALAVLFVPIQGRTLWSRGAAREVAQFVAHGLRSGWDAIASLGEEHARPTRPGRIRPARRQTVAEVRKSRDGIVAQPPKEKLQADDRAALDKLVSAAR